MDEQPFNTHNQRKPWLLFGRQKAKIKLQTPVSESNCWKFGEAQNLKPNVKRIDHTQRVPKPWQKIQACAASEEDGAGIGN